VGALGAGFALAVLHADRVNSWLWVLPQRLRGRGWGLLLAPVAVIYALLAGGDEILAVTEILAAVLAVIFVPRLARQAVPYALLILGGYGLAAAKAYHDGSVTQVLYGLVLAGAGSWRTHLVLAQAAVFFAAGLWLLVRVQAPGRTRCAAWRPDDGPAATVSRPLRGYCCCRSWRWPPNCSGPATGSARSGSPGRG
jgi:hypothetical protein